MLAAAIALGVLAVLFVVALWVARDIALRWFAHRAAEREEGAVDALRSRLAELEKAQRKIDERMSPLEQRVLRALGRR